MENSSRETGIGWPLGLGSISLRVRLVESFPGISAATSAAEHRSVYVNAPSSTFSSFSASTLDTESTISFFQDNSKTLGRLIGFRSRNDRRSRSEVYLRNSIDGLQEEHQRRNFPENHHHQIYRSSSNDDNDHGVEIEMCSGLCVPLCLLSKSNSTKVKLKELN